MQVITYLTGGLFMHKPALILLFVTALVQSQEIKNIGQLFDSLKTHPVSTMDQIRVEQALAAKTIAYSKLYPDVDLFGRYDYSSTAAAMLPLPLNELFAYKADPAKAQPFSQNIFRAGITVSMPIFMASIFPMAAKAKMMARSAEDQKNINLLKNEAVIVGADANLLYMQALDSALIKKKTSLLKTREFVVIKVNNGRAPESALLNIDNGISQIDITRNDLAIQREEAAAVIQTMTGVALKTPVNMMQTGSFKEGKIKALDPLREKVEADRLAYSSEKQKLLPSLMLQGSYSNNTADAYNNNEQVNNDYGAIGVILRIPLFARGQYAQIRKSRLDYEESESNLQQMSLELASQAQQLQNSLALLDNSIQLYNKSIGDKQRLLEIARVSYQSDQMSMEDYLKYEDDLVLEQSKLFKARAQKWQTLMKLDVIYGNNIAEVVK
jgi:outer membrane protein TolC